MSKTTVPANKDYSLVQYLFWLFSGAEISILKECPTDYNRQAGIGFTIFMTTLLAFCSGGYAGWYFGESYSTAIIFGIIWSTLIFSIDRSMVLTLKKDPTTPTQSFWAPFLSRAVLAILIAFIISIPLELLIFRENIDLHMDIYKLDQTYAIQQAAKRNEALSEKLRMQHIDSASKAHSENQSSKGEPYGDPVYNNLKADYQSRQREHDELSNKYIVADRAADNAYNNVPVNDVDGNKDKDSYEWRVYQSKRVISNIAKANFNKFDNIHLLSSKNALNEYLQNWATRLQREQDSLGNEIIKAGQAINKGFNTADSTGNVFEEKIKNKKGFVLRFMVLENLATAYKFVDSLDTNGNAVSDAQGNVVAKKVYDNEGATVSLLLWLIRILFFTIEILPTIVKIATPAGAYDIAIYQAEQDLALEMAQKTDIYLKHKKSLREMEYIAEKEQIKEQNKIENELHKDLLTEIASVQNKVARQKIKDFELLHLKQSTSPNQMKLEENFWRLKGSPNKIEYFFRNGSLTENELLYSENDLVNKGKWSFINQNKEISVELSNNRTDYLILEVDLTTLKLLDKAANNLMEFEKI